MKYLLYFIVVLREREREETKKVDTSLSWKQDLVFCPPATEDPEMEGGSEGEGLAPLMPNRMKGS